MRRKLLVLFLIPVCLLTFVGGVSYTTEANTIPVEVTKETTSVIAEPIIETAVPTTEPTTPETTVPVATEPSTETMATEPPTESTEPETELRSLGTFKLTAYCPCQKCCGKHALNRPVDENGDEIVYGSTGVRLVSGVSIAVDPGVIPYGTEIVINGHTYTAHDTGGAIKGNRIDVYFDDHQAALNFGVQWAEVLVYA